MSDRRGHEPREAEFRVDEGGIVTFDIHGLLRELPVETRLEIAESLACDEDVLRGVVDLLIDGATERFRYNVWQTGNPYYEKHRMRLLESVDHVAVKVIQEHIKIRDHQEREARVMREHARQMRALVRRLREGHALPDDYTLPPMPNYQHGSHYTKEGAQAVLSVMKEDA